VRTSRCHRLIRGLGQQVGRPVTQAPTDDGKQLAGDRMQRIAAHTQRPHAQTGGQDQSRAVAHRFCRRSFLKNTITATDSDLIMSDWLRFLGSLSKPTGRDDPAAVL
jgi:hypothetical protein